MTSSGVSENPVTLVDYLFVSADSDGNLHSTTLASQCIPIARPIVSIGSASLASGPGAWLLAILLPIVAIVGCLLALCIFALCCRHCWKGDEDSGEDYSARARADRNKSWKHQLAWTVAPYHMRRRVADAGPENRPYASTPLHSVSAESHFQSNQTVNQNDRKLDDDKLLQVPGFADAITNQNGADVALAEQQMDTSRTIEDKLLRARQNASIAIAQSHLATALGGDMKSVQDILSDFRHSIESASRDLDEEIQRRMHACDSLEPAKAKALASRLQAEHRHRRHMIFKESLEHLASLLEQRTALNQNQISNIVASVAKSLTQLEAALAQVLDKTIEIEYKHGAERRQLALDAKRKNASLTLPQHRKEAIAALNENMDQNPYGEKVLAKLNDGLVLKEEQAVKELREQLSAVRRQASQNRAKKLTQLQEKHQKEMDAMMKNIEQNRNLDNTNKLVNEMKAMLMRQAEQNANLWSKLDKDEATQMEAVNEETIRKYNEGVKSAAVEAIGNMDLSPDAKAALTAKYHNEMSRREDARQKRIAAEKNERQSLADQEKQELYSQQWKSEHHKGDELLEQHLAVDEDAMEKLTHGHMTQTERDALLAEHAHQKHLLGNLVRLNRLQQENQLQKRLAARKEAMKQHRASTDTLHRFLSSDVPERQRELSEYHANLIGEMKQNLNNETEDLLIAQRQRLAGVLGKLRVAKMRKQAFLDDREKLVKRLNKLRKAELELRQKAKHIKDSDPSQLDKLLDEHKEQVQKLNQSINEARLQQMRSLQMKIEENRLAKLRQLEAEGGSADTPLHMSQNRACTARIKQRRVSATERNIDHTITSEYMMERAKLNKKYRDELDKTLLEQKRQFLDQLNKIVNMSSAELKEAANAQSENSNNTSPVQSTSDDKVPLVPATKLPPIGSISLKSRRRSNPSDVRRGSVQPSEMRL